MSAIAKHPSLYEINTRILLKSISGDATLDDIPGKFWKRLRKKGIDWVWLMGVWEIREKELDPNLIPADMVQEFKELLPDLAPEDICGSPYAIHDYEVDPKLGGNAAMERVREKIHKQGMKLMLDFVPNHMGAHSRWAESNPEYFIEVGFDAYKRDPKTFYRPWPESEKYFAHGKDPYFDAWQDTVQINYASDATQSWLQDIIRQVAELCDGVRCDMAMLPVKRIFQQTWGEVMKNTDQMQEFWPDAIKTVKGEFNSFLFLAECYWDMESELMEMGFDYCYDKVFFDRLNTDTPDQMRQHFNAETLWLNKTARFLENHDEDRANAILELRQHMAAAALIAFGPGMRFWHMGQWEGWRKKIPVQLHRGPDEAKCGCMIKSIGDASVCTCLNSGYAQLLEINQAEIFRQGDWSVIREPHIPGVLVWEWKHEEDRVILAVNYQNVEVDFTLSDLGISDSVDNVIYGCHAHTSEVKAMSPWAVHLWRVTGV